MVEPQARDPTISKTSNSLMSLGEKSIFTEEIILEELLVTTPSPEDRLNIYNSLENKLDVVSERPLILYAYAESESARVNIQSFIAHSLHVAADFIFIFNGETDGASLLPLEPNI
jgi:hypothetical protein